MTIITNINIKLLDRIKIVNRIHLSKDFNQLCKLIKLIPIFLRESLIINDIFMFTSNSFCLLS
jgi:hypothetical protein